MNKRYIAFSSINQHALIISYNFPKIGFLVPILLFVVPSQMGRHHGKVEGHTKKIFSRRFAPAFCTPPLSNCSRRPWRGHRPPPTVGVRILDYRVIAVSCGIKISAVHHLVLSQYTRMTDRRTDRQTQGLLSPLSGGCISPSLPSLIIVQPGQGGFFPPLSQIGCRLHPIPPPCGRPWTDRRTELR